MSIEECSIVFASYKNTVKSYLASVRSLVLQFKRKDPDSTIDKVVLTGDRLTIRVHSKEAINHYTVDKMIDKEEDSLTAVLARGMPTGFLILMLESYLNKLFHLHIDSLDIRRNLHALPLRS